MHRTTRRILMALLVALLGGFSLQQMTQMRHQAEQVDDNWLPSVISVGRMTQDMLRIRALTLRLSEAGHAIFLPLDEASQAEAAERAVELLPGLHSGVAPNCCWSGTVSVLG